MIFLSDRAAGLYQEYRHARPETTLRETFHRLYPSGTPLIDSLTIEGGNPVTAVVSDNSVTLYEESWFIRGADTAFVNVDGKHGMVQHRVSVTPEGVSYVVQN
jgi:hypothetical protein